MKRLIIVFGCLLISVFGYAQKTERESFADDVLDSLTAYSALKFEIPESVSDSTAKVEIAQLQQQFEKDVYSVLNNALEAVKNNYKKVRKEIDKCISKAEKRKLDIEESSKEKDEQPSESDVIEGSEDLNIVEEIKEKEETSVYSEEYWEKQEGQLKDSDSLVNISAFVDTLLKADTNVQAYAPILADMDSLAGRISKLDTVIGRRLKGFVVDVKAVQYAWATLNEPYNREDKDRALNGLDSIMFLTPDQLKTCSVENMKEALRFYYFTTGNMLSLIQEIKDMHALYTHIDSDDKTKNDAQNTLKSNLSIDYNFKIIPYMDCLYKEIVSEIIKTDEATGQYQFDKFDMNRLDAIRQELEEVRKSNKK